MAIALKQAPETPKDTPIYTDPVIACGYQRTWLLAVGLIILLAGMIATVFVSTSNHRLPSVLRGQQLKAIRSGRLSCYQRSGHS